MQILLSEHDIRIQKYIDRFMELGRSYKNGTWSEAEKLALLFEMGDICFELLEVEAVFKVKYSEYSDLFDILLCLRNC
jgi:hypothetical protein